MGDCPWFSDAAALQLAVCVESTVKQQTGQGAVHSYGRRGTAARYTPCVCVWYGRFASTPHQDTLQQNFKKASGRHSHANAPRGRNE